MNLQVGKLYKFTGSVNQSNPNGKAIWLNGHVGYVITNEVVLVISVPTKSSNSIKLMNQSGIIGFVYYSKEEWMPVDESR